ncbi:MAG: hypothetical protein WCG01_01140, partial [bacterium]
MTKQNFVMNHQEVGDIRLASFFLYELLTKLAPCFKNKLDLSYDFRITLNCRHEIVMAIFEKIPNPKPSVKKAYFNEPLLIIEQDYSDNSFILYVDIELKKNQKTKSRISDSIKS